MPISSPALPPPASGYAPAEKSPAPEVLARPRLDSLDFLRGIVMVLMALDHVRDYFHAARFDPMDLSQTHAVLFFTRWITHFCAPVFLFLAGAGAYLYGRRNRSRGEVSWFLFSRGLWIVVLELTVVRWAWVFNLDYTFAIAVVMWSIGWSMMVLAALCWLPVRVVGVIGVAIICLHNLLDPLLPAQFGTLAWLWTVLHEGGMVTYSEGRMLFVGYPLIPWIGVIAAGYAFGTLLVLEEARRRRVLFTLGLTLTAAFVVLGLLNVYGENTPWVPQASPLFTVLNFLDVTKYPPSLQYLLMTLGPAIALIPLLERVKGPVKTFFVTFGRVPMFYYLLHIPLIHGLAVLTALLMGMDYGFMFSNMPAWEWPGFWGFSLGVVYLVWAGVVLLLYPVCAWYARLKMRNQNKWLSYL